MLTGIGPALSRRLVAALLGVVGTAGVPLGAEAPPQGKAVFEAQCAVCHGIAGDGQGPEAHRFFTRPADLTRGTFKFRSTPTGSLPTDPDLDRTIRRGLAGSGMVAQDHLSEAEIRDVIVYLKTLSPRWAEGAAPAPLPVLRPANLESLAPKGTILYKDAGCPECHGAGGLGDGPSAGRLTAGGRPTRPADLTRRPFKGGDRAEDIYRALAAGLDGTPMPSYRDALDEDQIWALAVYVVRLAPPGTLSQLTEDERIGREIAAAHQPRRRR